MRRAADLEGGDLLLAAPDVALHRGRAVVHRVLPAQLVAQLIRQVGIGLIPVEVDQCSVPGPGVRPEDAEAVTFVAELPARVLGRLKVGRKVGHLKDFIAGIEERKSPSRIGRVGGRDGEDRYAERGKGGTE